MLKIIKTIKVIRNNWKKSVFAASILAYGFSYTSEYFRIQRLMKVYCEKASYYGNQAIPVDKEPRSVTVILNPKSNNRKAVDEFEIYCAPLLHLAGITVDVIKTKSEGHARTLIDSLNHADAIVVAGGDGTLCEVITGVMRRTNESNRFALPIGVLPLGSSNTLAMNLFPNISGKIGKIKSLADATLAVVEEAKKPINIMKVEVIDAENKPIYGVSGIKWGAFRDAQIKKNTYWYYGKFRNYATYLFNGYKANLTWKCEAHLRFSPPCKGCRNCINNSNLEPKSWLQRFGKQSNSLARVINKKCEEIYERPLSAIDINLQVSNSLINESLPRLVLQIGPKTIDYISFIKEGVKYDKGEERNILDIIEARQIEIQPIYLEKQSNAMWFSIDNEHYELKPIRVTLLPNMINFFIKNSVGNRFY